MPSPDLFSSQSYGLEISAPVIKRFEQLYAVNATWTGNDTLRDENRQIASDHLVEIIQQPVEEALSGILWLFPCAVRYLFRLASNQLRSREWLSRSRPPDQCCSRPARRLIICQSICQ